VSFTSKRTIIYIKAVNALYTLYRRTTASCDFMVELSIHISTNLREVEHRDRGCSYAKVLLEIKKSTLSLLLLNIRQFESEYFFKHLLNEFNPKRQSDSVREEDNEVLDLNTRYLDKEFIIPKHDENVKILREEDFENELILAESQL